MRKWLFPFFFLFLALPLVSRSEFSYTDVQGRSLILEEAPQRVVSLYGSFAETWLLAGGKLAGATEDAVSERGLPLGDDVQIVGTVKEPNLEAVLALDPDFVILSADIAAQAPAAELLTQLGIPCSAFRVDTFEDYLSMLRFFCDLTGRDDLYAQNGETVAVQIEAVRSAVSAQPAASVLLLRAYGSGVKAKGNDNIAGVMLADLGADNIVSRHDSLLEDLSLEAIVAEDPEFIFITIMGADEEAALSFIDARFGQDPAWQGLKAVREGRLVVLPKDLFHYKPNARWGESYAYLAKILYPQCF